MTVSSDGGDNDWLKAKKLCQKILGLGMDFKLKHNRNLMSEFKDFKMFL